MLPVYSYLSFRSRYLNLQIALVSQSLLNQLKVYLCTTFNTVTLTGVLNELLVGQASLFWLNNGHYCLKFISVIKWFSDCLVN